MDQQASVGHERGDDARPAVGRRLSSRVLVGITRMGVGIPVAQTSALGEGTDSIEWLPASPQALALLMLLAGGTDQTDEELRARFSTPASLTVLDHLIDCGLLLAEGDAATPMSAGSGPFTVPEATVDEPFDDRAMVLDTPVLLEPRVDGFALHGELDGTPRELWVLRPLEVHFLARLKMPARPSEAIESSGIDEGRGRALVRAALAAGLMEPLADRMSRKTAHHTNQVTLDTSARKKHPSPTRDLGERVPVFGIWYDLLNIPLALGLVYSSLDALGRPALTEVFDTTPRFVQPDFDLAQLPDGPAVYLFSDYVWNTDQLLSVSAEIKRRNPEAITVHGGPNVPKYELDTREFFAANPSVDVAVIGEGELSVADLMSTLAEGFERSGRVDLGDLEGVAGVAFRSADGSMHRGEDRDRMEDPNVVPSPYLSGTFDSILPSFAGPILETNRGCPYKCTFCDWGSATNSRIRMYDAERVDAEIRWTGENHMRGIFIADANFGIRKRDIDFARRIASTKNEFGYPQEFTTNYAKNTVKYLQEIIEVLVDVGILTTGTVSLQSMDEVTLAAIQRSNIKTEKYDELTAEFREHGLPVNVHLMIGLPGQTTESMAQDLQQCIDREITAHVYETELLLNSPMNDPSYRERFGIGTEAVVSDFNILQQHPQSRQLVVSSTSFSREDYRYMGQLRIMYFLCETYGILRQVLRYLRRHAGVTEVDAMRRMLRLILDSPDAYPSLTNAYNLTHQLMVPPVSWAKLLSEVATLARTEWPDGDYRALDTVLEAQLAVIPAFGRQFPVQLDLDHDYVQWFELVRAAKAEHGAGNWVAHVPALADLGPAQFEVGDPRGINRAHVGNTAVGPTVRSWELHSAIERPAFN